MTQETYSYLCSNALERAITDTLEGIYSVDERNRSVIAFPKNLEVKKELIFKKYDRFRLQVRKRYFDTGREDENLMDIHKICACYIKAVRDVKVFEYSMDEEVSLEVFCSNYTVAFLAGIHVLYLSMLSDYLEQKNEKAFRYLDSQKTVFFPETNEGHDDYLIGRIKSLALTDTYGMDFDVLAYADMLYWIEKYNKYRVERAIADDGFRKV